MSIPFSILPISRSRMSLSGHKPIMRREISSLDISRPAAPAAFVEPSPASLWTVLVRVDPSRGGAPHWASGFLVVKDEHSVDTASESFHVGRDSIVGSASFTSSDTEIENQAHFAESSAAMHGSNWTRHRIHYCI